MRRSTGSLLIAIPAVIAFGWMVTPRERLLIPLSNRVTSTEPWTSRTVLGKRRWYGWLSDHELLHTVEHAGKASLAKLDLNSGADLGADALFPDTRPPQFGWSISPDGRNAE